MDFFKDKFQFSNGMAYRLFIIKEDETLTVKQVKIYSKCPKILYTKVSDKMATASSADPG